MAELKGPELKLVKIHGEFPWHVHETADETFLVFIGRMRLEFRDGVIALTRGQCAVVPRGIEHRPVAEEPAQIMLFEPAHVRNTGDLIDERFSAQDEVRI